MSMKDTSSGIARKTPQVKSSASGQDDEPSPSSKQARARRSRLSDDDESDTECAVCKQRYTHKKIAYFGLIVKFVIFGAILFVF